MEKDVEEVAKIALRVKTSLEQLDKDVSWMFNLSCRQLLDLEIAKDVT